MSRSATAPPISPIRKRSQSEPTTPRKKSKKQAHVTYVLDRSGSMSQFGSEGYSSVQATIKELPDVRGSDCLVSVFTFDNRHEQVADGMRAKDYVLPPETMEPRGMTALRDALRDAIEYIGALPEDQEKHLVVFTDGNDNCSKTTPTQISNMLKALNDVNVSWLAAAEADMSTAEQLGIEYKDVLKVGAKGDNMAAAMRSSSYKSDSGFSQSQRQLSIQ